MRTGVLVALALASGCDRLFALEHIDRPPPDARDGGAGSAPIDLAATGGNHTCAIRGGAVRCWGSGVAGRLGYGNTASIGDNETPASAGDVDVGGAAVQIRAGGEHTCVLDDAFKVRCWGLASGGRLGYGDGLHIGDDEPPSMVGAVNIGVNVTELAVGDAHTCVIIVTGGVRCWGVGAMGRLGYSSTENLGDNELPRNLTEVPLGATPIVDIVAGGAHTCALTALGEVRCWGSGISGQLGYGSTMDVGDDEVPSFFNPVNVGGNVTQLAAGTSHTCALLDTGGVRCWGAGGAGRLGYDSLTNIGDTEVPASAGDVDIGRTAIEIAAGGTHTCAVLDDHTLRCWGGNQYGQLGHGHTEPIGDDEAPSERSIVPVGEPVGHVWAGRDHTCVQLERGALRCWGRNDEGRLGYGHTMTLGDTEPAASVGDVPAF
ncbi:MAG TPA: hypothetical protein VIV11_04715 [Kofleriaceae bacterium]